MPLTAPYEPTPRDEQALAWMDAARENIFNGTEALIEVEAALVALRIQAGDLPEDDLDIEAYP